MTRNGRVTSCRAAMLEAFETTFPGAPSTGVAVATIGHNWAELKT